jgi:hypothetical protein
MESAILTTGLGLWWSKVGKWQIIATLVTLAVFYVTLYFTGNVKVATLAAATFVAVAAFAIALAAATLAAAAALTAVALTADEAVKENISKKAIWFSYAAEFIIIFVPMLITILH